MKLKPYKEMNTWKRHNVDVRFVCIVGKEVTEINSDNFHALNNFDRVKMIISFDGEDVYETKFGALGIVDTSYKILKRKGIVFKTVEKHVEFLGFTSVDECDQFIKWCEHFRISSHIQDVVRLSFIGIYNEEVQEVKILEQNETKYIKMW